MAAMVGVADGTGLSVRVLGGVDALGRAEWNRLCGADYPFLRHEFLAALEDGGSVGEGTGWQAVHLLAERDGAAVAVMPMYVKSHSWGEFAFDWLWAESYARAGLAYYPKLLSAIPFTPATGPRVGLADGERLEPALAVLSAAARQLAGALGASSWHVLFPVDSQGAAFERLGMSGRRHVHYRWRNAGYASFDAFLDSLSSRKRKAIRKERRRVAEQGVAVRMLSGAELSDAQWAFCQRCYRLTYARHSGHGGYLSERSLELLRAGMADSLVVALAERRGQPLAAAVSFQGARTLYGRYWGAVEAVDCLHFEACYYQGIAHCIRHGLEGFDPGVQGEHKVARGFVPVEARSAHWLAEPAGHAAVAEFNQAEAEVVAAERERSARHAPYRRGARTDQEK